MTTLIPRTEPICPICDLGQPNKVQLVGKVLDGPQQGQRATLTIPVETLEQLAKQEIERHQRILDLAIMDAYYSSSTDPIKPTLAGTVGVTPASWHKDELEPVAFKACNKHASGWWIYDKHEPSCPRCRDGLD